MIHVYHGDGKGKTSAAIGLAVRAAGAGKKVLFAQFMKGIVSSEIGVLEKIPGIEVLIVGKQFGFYRNMGQEEKAAITERHNEILMEIEKRVENGKAEVVVLDEITSAYRYQLADKELVQKVLRMARDTRNIRNIRNIGNTGNAENVVKTGNAEEVITEATDAGDVHNIRKAESKERCSMQRELQSDIELMDIELILTGRDPDESFLEAADYITEMKMERHPYEKGVPARKGIEY